MQNILPPEALDHIVDFLHDDHKSLSACSLASALLTPAARHHLFSELALAPAEINAFLELLDVPWTTIPPAIQSIAVEKRRCRRREVDEDGFYIPDDFARIVGSFGGVRSIRFEDVDLSEISPPFMHALYQTNKTEKIELLNTTTYVLEPLLRYISSLPNLRALSISSLKSEEPSTEDFHGVLSKFRMPLLDGGSSSTEVLHWIQAQNFVPSVDVFQIDLGVGPSASALVAEYARHLGDSVEAISVKWPTDQSNPAYVDYTLFPNLKSMRLQVGLRLGYTSDLILAERNIRAIADQIDSPYFSRVTLEIVLLPIQFAITFLGILEHTAFEAYKWRGIHDFLAEREIKEFVLVLRGLPKCQRVPVEQFLTAVPFASLHKAGRIRVVCD